MKDNNLKFSKSLKLITFLNLIFKIFVCFVFLWIVVTGFSQIQISNLDSNLSNNVSGNGELGYSVLDNYLPTWKVFRNLGYITVLIIFVIEAVVYFLLAHNKSELQESVKVQAKKTLLYELLLLFSYAIAGLAVDLVYLAHIVSRLSTN